MTKRFRKQLLPVIEKLLWEKKTLAEVANGLSISIPTLHKWLRNNAELETVLRNAREQRITEALYRKATGYEYTETRAEKTIIGKREVNTKTVIINKHCPPDASAAQVLLKQLNPERWNDKVELNHTGQVGLVYDNVLLLDLPPKKQQITDDRIIDIETA